MTDAPNNGRKAQLVEGPIGWMLVRLTFPMVWGMLAVMLFSVVDTFYVGRLGALPLAAMGFTFPVSFLVSSIAMGMGVGTSSAVSRAIGEGDPHRVQRLTTDSLVLSVVLVTLAATAGLFTITPVFRLLGADPEIIVLIRRYMVPWYLGIGFLVIPMVGNSAIRATGDTKTPSLIMIISGGLNIILDPFLIFGIGPFPRLELQGAALATVISWAVTFCAALWILGRRDRMIEWHWPRVREVFDSWKAILHVGLPAIGTNMMMPLSGGILTRMIAWYGPEAVAAFGVATRLESLAMAVFFALSTAMAAFVGQNYGAGRCDRVREALRKCTRFSLVWGLGLFAVLAGFARPLARLFNDDPTISGMAATYLWIVPVSYGAFGIMVQSTATFNATGRPLQSAIIFFLRLFVLTVPLAYAGSRWLGATGIFAGIAAANLVVGGAAILMVRGFLKGAGGTPHELSPELTPELKGASE